MDAMTDIGSISRAVSGQAAIEKARLRKVCADFESIFVHYILKSARKAIPQSGIFNSSHESKIYRSMMDERMAQAAARGRGMGLGQMLYEQLKGDGH